MSVFHLPCVKHDIGPSDAHSGRQYTEFKDDYTFIWNYYRLEQHKNMEI